MGDCLLGNTDTNISTQRFRLRGWMGLRNLDFSKIPGNIHMEVFRWSCWDRLYQGKQLTRYLWTSGLKYLSGLLTQCQYDRFPNLFFLLKNCRPGNWNYHIFKRLPWRFFFRTRFLYCLCPFNTATQIWLTRQGHTYQIDKRYP